MEGNQTQMDSKQTANGQPMDGKQTATGWKTGGKGHTNQIANRQ